MKKGYLSFPMANLHSLYAALLAAAICCTPPFTPAFAATEEAAHEAAYLPSHPIQLLRGGKPVAEVRAEMALTLDQKRHGLMFRESMPPDAGMLFVYHQPLDAQMWMKNTLIPLDMLFIDADFQVVHIHRNAEPHSLTAIGAGRPVWAVLELNGGAADTLGIAVGDSLRIPPEALSRKP